MADFYSVLARAVSRLPHNDAEMRQELYARARTLVAAQPQGLAAQTQQAVLETAIARVEAEAQAKATVGSLAKLLQVLEMHEPLAGESTTADGRPASAISAVIEADHSGGANTVADLSRLPALLGTMLFGTAYAAAAVAFTGVTYLRAIVWVEEDVIGYRMLAVVMAATIGLFLIPLAIVRWTSNSFAKGRFSRFIYSTARRGLNSIGMARSRKITARVGSTAGLGAPLYFGDQPVSAPSANA